MLKELIHLANHLDQKGFRKEADYLDHLLNKKADWQGRFTVLDRNWEDKEIKNEYGKITGSMLQTTFTIKDELGLIPEGNDGKDTFEITFTSDPIDLQELEQNDFKKMAQRAIRSEHNLANFNTLEDRIKNRIIRDRRSDRDYGYVKGELVREDHIRYTRDFADALWSYIVQNRLVRNQFNPTDPSLYEVQPLDMPEPSLVTKWKKHNRELEEQEQDSGNIEMEELEGFGPEDSDEEEGQNFAKDLVHLANHLDSKGLKKEADALDSILTKLSGTGGWEMGAPLVSSDVDFDYDLNNSDDCESCDGKGYYMVKKKCPMCEGAGEFDSEYEIPAERVPKAVRQDYIGRRHRRNQGRPSREYGLARRMKRNM